MNVSSSDGQSHEKSPDTGRSDAPSGDGRSRGLWRGVRRVLWIVAGCYLFVFAMLYAFQRSLTYFPHQQATIDPAEAGLPSGQVHAVSCRTDDGLTLNGWHILPSGRSARDVAECDEALADARWVVLFFSGNAGHRGYRGMEGELLASCGCHVFLFDYRGYGDNLGEPGEEALASDARRMWKYVTEERHVPAERVILFGESLGGGVAVRLASERCAEGTPPGGLVLRSTFSSLVDVAAIHYPWLPVRWAMHERYPSTERIGQVTCPILQLHGTSDAIVPISSAQQLFAAAPERSSSGVPKRFVPLVGADHNDVLDVAGIEVAAAVREFLESSR